MAKDAGDRLLRLEDHEGDATDYHYNERNELLRVDYDGHTVAYGYDKVGRLVSTSLPNGIHCQRNYDQRNRLVYLHYQKAGQPLLSYKYAHNQLGQRVVEEKISAEQCKLSRYSYNPRRELVRSDRLINGCRTLTHYQYDLNHNRTKKDRIRFHHNRADQLTAYDGGGSLDYNPQGQATAHNGFEFGYNHAQQIKSASGQGQQVTYHYDGSGRRVGKEFAQGPRIDQLLMGQEVLKTYEDDQLKAKYFLGLGREGIYSQGEWRWYLSDGLGSTITLTDEAGQPVASWDYDDYGETTQISGDSDIYNPFLYTGQEWDAELGMYYLRARHYAPELGRFLARDPIGYSGGSNLYAYCAGDPINHVDPTGLWPDSPNAALRNALAAGNVEAALGIVETHVQLYGAQAIGPIGTALLAA